MSAFRILAYEADWLLFNHDAHEDIVEEISIKQFQNVKHPAP